MLRLYKPIQHDIFKLQTMLEHLVCKVWCDADDNSCESKLDPNFKPIYKAYKGKKSIDDIYEECKKLNVTQKQKIKEAFEINNRIEELCDGRLMPVYLKDLPEVVDKKIKPLLVDFYEDLLEQSRVPGTKLDYYSKLIQTNGYKNCPCCGLSVFEPPKDEDIQKGFREDFDHYLPKSIFPFASVNFQNLVPLCTKCNRDRKKDKNPIENNCIAFYPFSSEVEHNIDIEIILAPNIKFKDIKREDIVIYFKGDNPKINTWNRLFDIEDRYNRTIRTDDFIKTFLNDIRVRFKRINHKNKNWTYINMLDAEIEIFEENNKYVDERFLKIPLMKALKTCTHVLEVYG